MTALRHCWRHIGLCIFLLVLAGCAHQRALQSLPGEQDAHWQGRLAVKVFSKPVQSFSASFELQGRPESGQLILFSPLGTTLAHLVWTPGSATLKTEGKEQHFESLQAMARSTTGADLPVASLFAWLRGQPEEAAGWQADLSGLPDGRLFASHVEEVQAELKIVLDR